MYPPPEDALAEAGRSKEEISSEPSAGHFQKKLGIDSEFVPGGSTEIDVTPREAGTFTAICDRFCGSGHGGMKMTFVGAAEVP